VPLRGEVVGVGPRIGVLMLVVGFFSAAALAAGLI
jgi:hypothetical protein